MVDPFILRTSCTDMVLPSVRFFLMMDFLTMPSLDHSWDSRSPFFRRLAIESMCCHGLRLCATGALTACPSHASPNTIDRFKDFAPSSPIQLSWHFVSRNGVNRPPNKMDAKQNSRQIILKYVLRNSLQTCSSKVATSQRFRGSCRSWTG